MSTSKNTILIIGGTSGIGEAFARRFHSMGKKVIVTGRRQEKLNQLQQSLDGLGTYAFDVSDLSSIPAHVEKLFNSFPDIDTVWANAGIQVVSDIKDLSSTTDARVIDEITTNVTAPLISARHIIPRLIAQKKETNFMITSSGLGFAPVGSLFPVYCPTKAAIHSYLVGLRQALKDTDVNVLELVPPYVATDLDAAFKDRVKLPKPMALDEFMDDVFKRLDGSEAKDLKELSAGTGIARVEAWRSGVGEMLAKSGLGG